MELKNKPGAGGVARQKQWVTVMTRAVSGLMLLTGILLAFLVVLEFLALGGISSLTSTIDLVLYLLLYLIGPACLAGAGLLGLQGRKQGWTFVAALAGASAVTCVGVPALYSTLHPQPLQAPTSPCFYFISASILVVCCVSTVWLGIDWNKDRVQRRVKSGA